MNGDVDQEEEQYTPSFLRGREEQQPYTPSFLRGAARYPESIEGPYTPSFLRKEEPEAETPLKSFGRAALHEVVPTVAGVGASLLGAPAGIPGMLATGWAGYAATKEAQEAVLNTLGFDDSHQMAVNARTNPKSTFAGQLAPQLLTFRPGAATTAARVGGGALFGGFEAGREYLGGEEFDPYKIGVSGVAGAALQKPTALTERMAGQVERLGPRFKTGMLPEKAPTTRPWETPGAPAEMTTPAERAEYGLPPTAQPRLEPPGIALGDQPVPPKAAPLNAGRVREHAETIREQGGRIEDNPYELGTRAYTIWDDAFKGTGAAEGAAHGPAGPKAQAPSEPVPPLSQKSATQEAQNQAVRSERQYGKRAAAVPGEEAPTPPAVNEIPYSYADPTLEAAITAKQGAPAGGQPPNIFQQLRDRLDRERAEQGLPPGRPLEFPERVPPAEPGGAPAPGIEGEARPGPAAAEPPVEPAAPRPVEPPPTGPQRLRQAMARSRGFRVKGGVPEAIVEAAGERAARAGIEAEPERVAVGKKAGIDEQLAAKGFSQEAIGNLNRLEKARLLRAESPADQRAILEQAAARRPAEPTPPPEARPITEEQHAAATVAATPKPTPSGGFFGKLVGGFKAGISQAALKIGDDLNKLNTNTRADKSLLTEMGRNAEEKYKLTNAQQEEAHHAIEQGKIDQLTGTVRKYVDEFLQPIREQTMRLRQRMKDLGYDSDVELDPNHMYRVRDDAVIPQDISSDPTQAYKGRGFKIEPGTRKPRDAYALEDADGNRIIVARNRTANGEDAGWSTFKQGDVPHPTGLTEIKPGMEVKMGGKNYTVKEALTTEIEKNTPIRYIKNAGNSVLLENAQMRQAVREAEFLNNLKQTPAWLERATRKPTEEQLKAGWAESRLPQLKGWFFNPEWKAAFDDFYRPGFGGEGGLHETIRNINNFAVKSMFWSPIPHSVNAIVHWGIARGWDWFDPTKYPEMFNTMNRAIGSVMKQDKLQRELLRDGTSLIYAGLKNDKFEENLGKLLRINVKTDPAWDPVKKAFGLGPTDALNAIDKVIYTPSRNILWATNDILMTQRILELEGRGLSREAAIHDARIHMPDYRVPISIMGSRFVSQLVQDNRLIAFGRYHYGMMASLTRIARDSLSPNATKEERMAAFGNVAAMALMGVVGTGLTKMVQYATDNPEAEIRPRGPFGPMRAAYEMATGKTGYERIANSMLTFQPSISVAKELLANQDYFGHKIVEPGALARGKYGEAAGQFAHHLAHGLVIPYGQFSDAFRTRPTPEGVLGGMAQQGLGIKVPTQKQIAGKRFGERKQIQESIKREQKPRGLLESVTRGF